MYKYTYIQKAHTKELRDMFLVKGWSASAFDIDFYNISKEGKPPKFFLLFSEHNSLFYSFFTALRRNITYRVSKHNDNIHTLADVAFSILNFFPTL